MLGTTGKPRLQYAVHSHGKRIFRDTDTWYLLKISRKFSCKVRSFSDRSFLAFVATTLAAAFTLARYPCKLPLQVASKAGVHAVAYAKTRCAYMRNIQETKKQRRKTEKQQPHEEHKVIITVIGTVTSTPFLREGSSGHVIRQALRGKVALKFPKANATNKSPINSRQGLLDVQLGQYLQKNFPTKTRSLCAAQLNLS